MKIKPFPLPLCKGAFGKISLSPEQEAWMREYFPLIENPRIMEATGLSNSTLHRIAREFGLVKSEEGMRGIKHRQALRIKRVCERNGYYDSIRGKPPSPQCIEASRKRWQLVREGKLLHPLAKLRQEHPRKYANRNRRIGESRRRLFRREQLRLASGLKPETRLSVRLMPFTRSQASHRYNALKRGYWFYEDCSEQGGERYNIYYDSDTQRSEKFENNLRKDGFNVLDGTNL